MSSEPLKILNISITSARTLLLSSVVSLVFVVFHRLSPEHQLSGCLLQLLKHFNIFKYCLHDDACTQYAGFGLTSDWNNFSMIRVSSLFTNALLIIPRVLLADFAAVTHWLVDFSDWWIITPRSFFLLICPDQFVAKHSLAVRFKVHFPGEPGLAGVYWSKGWWKWRWQLEL